MRELRPRLWYWTARHPDWTPEDGGDDGWEPDVGCYAYVPLDGDELVLFDPLVPPDDTFDGERFWRALHRDVEHHGPPQVLITLFWHARSAQRILDRYGGARVWAYGPAADEVGKRTPVTNVFELDDPLPAGIEAIDAAAANEVVYWLPEHRGVVAGDSLLAPPDGPVRVWVGGDDTRQALRPLLDRPLELLLLTHGDPVLEGGREALARALEA